MTTTIATEEATKAMENLTVAAPRGTAKRDALRSNEKSVQQKWEEQKAFESEPEYGDNTKESFMVTFPYPYSNGHLHIGHAFTLTKALFRAQYERHQGKNVLFPFAFHCTGMPIQAVRKQISVLLIITAMFFKNYIPLNLFSLLAYGM
jgi:leucyl-tRNA synthetase